MDVSISNNIVNCRPEASGVAEWKLILFFLVINCVIDSQLIECTYIDHNFSIIIEYVFIEPLLDSRDYFISDAGVEISKKYYSLMTW